MADRSTERKATPRKLKKEQNASASSTQSASRAGVQPKMGGLPVRSHLEKGISELQELHEVLLYGDLDPRVLADFRDAMWVCRFSRAAVRSQRPCTSLSANGES
jgi:hypothetical protein